MGDKEEGEKEGRAGGDACENIVCSPAIHGPLGPKSGRAEIATDRNDCVGS